MSPSAPAQVTQKCRQCLLDAASDLFAQGGPDYEAARDFIAGRCGGP